MSAAPGLWGIPTEFLYLPDEGHRVREPRHVRKPRNRRLWWSTVLDWTDSYLSR